MPRRSLSLSPLNTTFVDHSLQFTRNDNTTPTPNSPRAEHSPQLITPQVRTICDSPISQTVKEGVESARDRISSISMVSAEEPLQPSTHLQNKIFNRGEFTFSSPISPKAKSGFSTRTKMPTRRDSRFDPMTVTTENEEMVEDEGYGELGQKHPLRRLKEENLGGSKINPPQSISLPPIKSLFGVASDHPQTPSSSSLFQSPSLPSLIPNSPSGSPSSAGTSRYSSLTSSGGPDNVTGWWAPEFEKGSSPFQPVPFRSNSFPTIPYVSDETGQKRRRSDGPPALRDAEESARLRWQAQSRNASFPMAHSPSTPMAGPSNLNSSSSSGLRTLLHPPQASSAGVSASMSRSSFSGSTTGGRLSPTLEDEPAPFARRPSQASRNPSLVGGQLSSHFAGLTATDRERSLSVDMPPPLQSAPPERRGSSMLPPLSAVDDHRLFPPPSSLSRSASPATELIRNQSLTRPPSPEASTRPELRRSSLTEIIKQKSGDMALTPIRFGQHPPPSVLSSDIGSATSVSMDKSSLSEPVPPPHAIHSAPLWSNRRESNDSMHNDLEGRLPSLRGRKRSVDTRQEEMLEDTDLSNTDPGMRGMEVLLAAAAVEEGRQTRKSSEEDIKDEDSPAKLAGNGNATGGPKYTCAYCAKTFSRPSSLRIHTYSHTGERPYICKEPTCRRRFSVQSNLKRHAKVHQLGGSAMQQQNGHPGLLTSELGPSMHGHPDHPGMPRAPHSFPGTVQGGPMYHPQPPHPGYYPPPPPGYGHSPHPLHPAHGHPYGDRYGGPPGPHGYGQPPHIGMPGPPQSQVPGWRSISSSRRASKDEEYSEGEEEEEIDELEEDD